MRFVPCSRWDLPVFSPRIVLMVCAACADSQDRRRPADDIVGLNNRGVGLMGQFNYDGARDIFARAAAAASRIDSTCRSTSRLRR